MAWEGRPAGPLAHPTPMPRGLGVEVPEPRTVPGLLLLFFFWSCSVFVAGSRLFLQLQSGEPLSSCNGSQSTGPVVVATDFVASRHVASSWTRNLTRVSCVGR